VTVLSVPFHLDEQITGFVPPVPPDEVIAPALPAGGPWERMAVLYAEVADAVDLDGCRWCCRVTVRPRSP
jgi:arginase